MIDYLLLSVLEVRYRQAYLFAVGRLNGLQNGDEAPEIADFDYRLLRPILTHPHSSIPGMTGILERPRLHAGWRQSSIQNVHVPGIDFCRPGPSRAATEAQ